MVNKTIIYTISAGSFASYPAGRTVWVDAFFGCTFPFHKVDGFVNVLNQTKEFSKTWVADEGFVSRMFTTSPVTPSPARFGSARSSSRSRIATRRCVPTSVSSKYLLITAVAVALTVGGGVALGQATKGRDTAARLSALHGPAGDCARGQAPPPGYYCGGTNSGSVTITLPPGQTTP